MIERFPYGRAPFWLLVVALTSALLLLATRNSAKREPPADLSFATFTVQHYEAYRRVLPAFERAHGVKVRLQLVDQRALQSRLQNAMLAQVEVPDLVEIVDGSLGYFTRGPLEDVGFVDLTERMTRQGYAERIVPSRLRKWESRGHLFAVPHDVHPVMLAYRADLVEALGVRVENLDTWAAFAAEGRRVSKDLDQDGVIDRYMIDLPASGGFGLNLLLLQRGVSLFDRQGAITFNDPRTLETMIWYLHQVRGPRRIATDCGWGQPFAKAMADGLALFFIAPDWRSYLIQTDVPALAGKLKLMPLPAWEKGGRRTSVWGGTGLAITKQSARKELAWELAEFLYFTPGQLGARFANTHVLPPFIEAWTLPEFSAPSAFYSGQRLGTLYAELAAETPVVWDSPYAPVAEAKLSEVFLHAAQHFDRHGDDGLRELVVSGLNAAEKDLTRIVERDRFGGRL